MARTMQPDLNGSPMSESAQAVTTSDPDLSVTTDDDLFDEELLVEEISIDGMCGVY